MKILYVATLSNTINAFLIRHIHFLIDKGYSVDIACSVEKEVHKDLVEMGCKVHDIPFTRSPLTLGNVKAYKELKKILLNENYDIIHTHTPVASLITRLVSNNVPKTRVFYTAHGFHFHKTAPLKNWVIYYPMEKLLARRTDSIITINKEDYNRALSNLKSKRVTYMPGVGVNETKVNISEVDVQEKKKDIQLKDNSFVLVSVGEVNDNKNQEVIIKAVSKLNNKNIFYLICGTGSKLQELKSLTEELGLQENVLFLGYRQDVNEILQVSDVFVFPSKREGLGMAAIEAMANRLPLLCSNVHGINDYTFNYYNCLKYSPNDIEGFSFGINYLYNNKELCDRMGKRNQSYAKNYSWENVKPYLSNLYTDNK